MKKEMIKLTVTHAVCSRCGFERILYFTSGYFYGERIVSTKSGKYCAYVNLLNENIIQELKKYCTDLFLEKKISISKEKLARIVSNIYGITCDNICNEKVDTIPNSKCPDCCVRTMVENQEYGERLMEVPVPQVPHHFWESLDKDAKRNEIEKELFRQRYLES